MKDLIILFLVVLSFACCKNANTQRPENTSVSDTSFKMTLSNYYEDDQKIHITIRKPILWNQAFCIMIICTEDTLMMRNFMTKSK